MGENTQDTATSPITLLGPHAGLSPLDGITPVLQCESSCGAIEVNHFENRRKYPPLMNRLSFLFFFVFFESFFFCWWRKVLLLLQLAFTRLLLSLDFLLWPRGDPVSKNLDWPFILDGGIERWLVTFFNDNWLSYNFFIFSFKVIITIVRILFSTEL